MAEPLKRILIIGGYGVFGTRIARVLGRNPSWCLYLGGRHLSEAKLKVQQLKNENPNLLAEPVELDFTKNISAVLAQIKPDLVIHTSGPFQGQNFNVLDACLEHSCHYIDLSDSREFVMNMVAYEQEAEKKKVYAITGASSVPGLSSAAIDHWLSEFSQLKKIEFGIAPGNRTVRGISTVSAVLSYVGKAIPVWKDEQWKTVYGWQDTHKELLPDVGERWVANCDIPDLWLFPMRYQGVTDVRFYAGHELTLLHLGLWCVSWLVRMKLIWNLRYFAKPLAFITDLFLKYGTASGGMFVKLTGLDANQKLKRVRWYILADEDNGPQIPCTAAILLAKKILSGNFAHSHGIYPCLGLFTLEEFMDELKGLKIWQKSFVETVE